jgi:hypothetical protein
MNTRRLLVPGLLLGCILFAACTPPAATPTPTVVPPTSTPTAIPIDLGPIVGRYYNSGSIFTLTPFDLLPDGSYYYEPDGDVQFGTFTVSQDQVTFTEKTGVCGSVPGTYKWS